MILRRTLGYRRIYSSAIVSEGKALQIKWKDGKESLYHAPWLLHNCKTMLHETGQRLKVVEHLNPELRIKSVSAYMDKNEMNIEWKGYSEVSSFSLHWLKKHSYSNMKKDDDVKLEKIVLPEIEYNEIKGNDSVGTFKLLENIIKYGSTLVRNVPCKNGKVLELANCIAFPQQTIYGTQFEVKSEPQAINVAYTPHALVLHQDLVYYESPPGIQLLHALKFDDDVRGGESTLLDAHSVAEELRVRDPKSFSTLCRIPATFQKSHLDRDYPAQLFYQRPHIVVNNDDKITAVFWAPQFEGVLHVHEKDVEDYYKAYKAFQYLIEEDEEVKTKYFLKFRLKAGEVLIFNNRRMLHGRENFSSNKGIRHLQGCYVNIDEYVNRYRVLRLKYGNKEFTNPLPPLLWGSRVGNQSHQGNDEKMEEASKKKVK